MKVQINPTTNKTAKDPRGASGHDHDLSMNFVRICNLYDFYFSIFAGGPQKIRKTDGQVLSESRKVFEFIN